MRIEQFKGEWLEPLSTIELDTANEQILIDFGSWCTSISAFSAPLAQAYRHPIVRARELTEGWLSGVVKLASYSDETGWRGSKIIDGGALPDAVEPVPVAIGDHGLVIVKSPWRRDWRSWRRTGAGVWVECEVPTDGPPDASR